VLGYLVDATPVGAPLNPATIRSIPGLQLPSDAARWATTPMLKEVAGEFGWPDSALAHWQNQTIAALYRDGICGGALLRAAHEAVAQEMVVPLAHQSALAGIMLATQLLVASVPELHAFRPLPTEARFNVLAGLPQEMRLPRRRTEKYLCSNRDFLRFYSAKWSV